MKTPFDCEQHRRTIAQSTALVNAAMVLIAEARALVRTSRLATTVAETTLATARRLRTVVVPA